MCCTKHRLADTEQLVIFKICCLLHFKMCTRRSAKCLGTPKKKDMDTCMTPFNINTSSPELIRLYV